MSGKDGGPAWPTSAYEGVGGEAIYQEGMSLRDWFAGQALAGMMATNSVYGVIASGSKDPDEIAGMLYVIADAMLRAREGDDR